MLGLTFKCCERKSYIPRYSWQVIGIGRSRVEFVRFRAYNPTLDNGTSHMINYPETNYPKLPHSPCGQPQTLMVSHIRGSAPRFLRSETIYPATKARGFSLVRSSIPSRKCGCCSLSSIGGIWSLSTEHNRYHCIMRFLKTWFSKAGNKVSHRLQPRIYHNSDVQRGKKAPCYIIISNIIG